MFLEKPWKSIILFVAAFTLFSFLFRDIVFNFWWQMALSVAGLCALGAALDRRVARTLLRVSREDGWQALGGGLLSAAILYGVFYVGNSLMGWMRADSVSEIASVYALKADTSPWLIGALIVLVIGPGEELFWRGFFLESIRQHTGKHRAAWLTILAYGSVHVVSGNPSLILAACLCGAFWTFLMCRYQSITLNIISHVAWDLAVFLLWPLASP